MLLTRDEVEYAMLAGILAGKERAPCLRGDGLNGGLKRAVYTASHQPFHLLQDVRYGTGARWTPSLPDEAVCTAQIASVLNLNEGTRSAPELTDDR